MPGGKSDDDPDNLPPITKSFAAYGEMRCGGMPRAQRASLRASFVSPGASCRSMLLAAVATPNAITTQSLRSSCGL